MTFWNHALDSNPILLTVIPFLIVLGADVTLSLPLVSAKVGATVSVTCTVTGETFLGWYNPSGSKITTSTGADIRVESSGNKHKLKFVDVKVSYGSNKYECRGSKNRKTLIVHVPCKYKFFILLFYYYFNQIYIYLCCLSLSQTSRLANPWE